MVKYEIKTKTADPAGKSERYAWEATLILPDGTRKPVLRRRDQDGQPFLNSQATLADLRDALPASRKTGFTEPRRRDRGRHVPRPPGERDRRLLGELAYSLALVATYTAGSQDSFLRNDMAVDATRQRLREIALACTRLSAELKARHPGVRWRALTGLPAVLGHGPYPAWEISRHHLTQLQAVIDTETQPAANR